VKTLEALKSQTEEIRETHISRVYLTADEAWKIKKPVDLGFLDFTTQEKRVAVCEAELELNRRLAPDVYKSVERLAGGEPAVRMRRLPDRDRADVRLAEGRLSPKDLARVAEVIAGFHLAARRDDETARFGDPAVVARNVAENIEQTEGDLARYLTPREAGELAAAQVAFTTVHKERFEERVAHGYSRDGHGDLRLEHVYIRDPDERSSSQRPKVAILDCIEFNERFRYGDVAADVAFLSMDLELKGRPDLAERFLARYAQHTGDFGLYRLVDFYAAYRAWVRGKIAVFGANDPSLPEPVRRAHDDEARRSFLRALSGDRRPLLPPTVIAVGGLIASGKSTLSDAVSDRLGAPVVETDRTRKQMLGVAPTTRVFTGSWDGAYDPAFTVEVYAEVRARAEAALSSGRSVILDASFRSRKERAEARALADAHDARFLFLEASAPVDVCKARCVERARNASVSDGRVEIFDDFAARFEPIDELGAAHVVVDTTQPLERVLTTLEEVLPLEAAREAV
jgi:aminoglycoside phosphotransferase family enzyme/predicted kinase